MRGPYYLVIDGEFHEPSSFGPLRNMRGGTIWNPDRLFQSAQQAAQRVAVELETDVAVAGTTGSGKEKELVEAFRCHQYREGDFVFVSMPRSFNYVRCARPRS